VLSFVFEGLANKEIADRLQISETAVKLLCSNSSPKQAFEHEASWSGWPLSNTGINSIRVQAMWK